MLRFVAALFIDNSRLFFIASHDGSLLLIGIIKSMLSLAILSLPGGGTLNLIGATAIQGSSSRIDSLSNSNLVLILVNFLVDGSRLGTITDPLSKFNWHLLRNSRIYHDNLITINRF